MELKRHSWVSFWAICNCSKVLLLVKELISCWNLSSTACEILDKHHPPPVNQSVDAGGTAVPARKARMPIEHDTQYIPASCRAVLRHVAPKYATIEVSAEDFSDKYLLFPAVAIVPNRAGRRIAERDLSDISRRFGCYTPQRELEIMERWRRLMPMALGALPLYPAPAPVSVGKLKLPLKVVCARRSISCMSRRSGCVRVL